MSSCLPRRRDIGVVFPENESEQPCGHRLCDCSFFSLPLPKCSTYVGRSLAAQRIDICPLSEIAAGGRKSGGAVFCHTPMGGEEGRGQRKNPSPLSISR